MNSTSASLASPEIINRDISEKCFIAKYSPMHILINRVNDLTCLLLLLLLRPLGGEPRDLAGLRQLHDESHHLHHFQRGLQGCILANHDGQNMRKKIRKKSAPLSLSLSRSLSFFLSVDYG